MFRGKAREPVLVLICYLITCSLYGVYWHYKVSGEIQQALGRMDDVPPGLEILLIIITCGIYGIYWWYKYGKMAAELRARNNLPPNDNSLLYVLLYVFGGVGALINPMIMQSDLNQVWQL